MTDAEVGTITEMLLVLSPSLKREEGRKGLEAPGHSGCLVQCGTDIDKSLENMKATESMQKGLRV